MDNNEERKWDLIRRGIGFAIGIVAMLLNFWLIPKVGYLLHILGWMPNSLFWGLPAWAIYFMLFSGGLLGVVFFKALSTPTKEEMESRNDAPKP